MKRGIFYTLCLFLATAGALFAGDGPRGEDHPILNAKDAKDAKDADRDRDEKGGFSDRDDRSHDADRNDIDRHDADRHDNESDDRSNRDKKQPCPPPAAPASPSIQASGIAFSSVTSSQMSVSWTKGNGSGRAVFVKQCAGSSAKPEKNMSYTANPIFSKGQQIGSTDWYCVYNGAGTSVTVTGLAGKTPYRVQVCEFNGSGSLVAWNSNDASGNPANQTTPKAVKNQPPVLASIGAKSVNEAQALTFTVSATDPDGTIPALTATGLPQNAAFADSKNGTGTFSWTPGYDKAGTYKVTFKASDGTLTDSEQVTVTVNNVDRPPVLGAIEPKTVDEAAALTFTVSATDPDGDVPVLSAENLPAGATFANGTFSWTPGYDQSGNYTVTLKASDGTLSASEPVTITVNNVNRPPVLAAIDPKTVDEAQPLTFTVSATDPDGDVPVLSAENLPAGATFANGSFSWTPGYDQSGNYTVTLKASDGTLTAGEQVAITVNNVNRPPVLAAIDPKSVDEAQALTFTVSATDPDGDVLVLSADQLPAGATFTNGAFSWTPTFDQAGTYTVTFKASDGTLSASEQATITVNNVNRPPVLAAIGDKTVSEAQTLSFTVTAIDPDGTPTLSADPLPAGATFTPATGVFSWTPSYTQSGSYSVTFKAADGPLADSQAITITVKDVNRPPVIAAIGDTTVNEAQPLFFSVSATDSDGTVPGLSASGLPAGAGLFDKGDGTAAFSWTPTYDQAGVYSVTISASDGIATSNATVLITVKNVNRKPTITAKSFYSAVAGQALQFTVSATDPDGTPLTLSATGAPAGAGFVDNGNGTGTFSWTPVIADEGEYSVRFIVSDGESADTAAVKVIVLEKPINEGLAGYWRFDETSGTTVVDGSGQWHNGTLIGGATRVADVPPVLAGESKSSLKLQSYGQYSSVKHIGIYNDFSVSLWFKPDATQRDVYPGLFDYGDRRICLCYTNSNYLIWFYFAGPEEEDFIMGSCYVGSVNTWHHVAATVKGDTLKLYLDGVRVAQNIKSGELSLRNDIVNIGSEYYGTFFNGGVDEVRFYNRALNQIEVAALFQGDGGGYNVPPQVNAGRDTILTDIAVPVSIALVGKAQDDNLAGPEITVRWREITGPSAVVFSDSTSLLTNVTFSSPGTYILALGAGDGKCISYDSIEIQVNAAAVQLSEGLVGYWRFDEYNGATAVDGSGQGHNGTLINGATRVADVPPVLSGVSKSSLKLNNMQSYGQYATVKHIGIYNDFSVSLWFKPDATQRDVYPGLFDYGDRRICLCYNNSNYLIWFYFAGPEEEDFIMGSCYVGSVNTWHHVAATVKGDTLKLYLDGVRVAQNIKSGELSLRNDIVNIGSEYYGTFFNGGVDEVRFYNRALNQVEVGALFQGAREINTQQIAIMRSSGFSDNPANNGKIGFTDLSTLIRWGGNSAGISAFVADTIQTRACLFLSRQAVENEGSEKTTDLKSFSALDYAFPQTISHDTGTTVIEFKGRWEAESSNVNHSGFSLVLMDNYPVAGVSGLDLGNFSGNPYGTPAITAHIDRNSTASYLQYGGANGGKFDNYQNKWWLPGSVSPTDGSASLTIGVGDEYPLSSWKSMERAMGDTAWANYKWLIRPDGMELYRNDTLYGTMDLPAYSYTAPGYTRYDQFKALRLAWQGQCYVSDLSISIMPVASAPNHPPQIAFINPLHDTTVVAGSGFYLQASASDADGTIDRVEFYANNQLLGTCTQAPYAYSWQSVPEGTIEVTVVAIDDQGAVSVGKVLKITTVDRFSVNQ